MSKNKKTKILTSEVFWLDLGFGRRVCQISVPQAYSRFEACQNCYKTGKYKTCPLYRKINRFRIFPYIIIRNLANFRTMRALKHWRPQGKPTLISFPIVWHVLGGVQIIIFFFLLLHGEENWKQKSDKFLFFFLFFSAEVSLKKMRKWESLHLRSSGQIWALGIEFVK